MHGIEEVGVDSKKGKLQEIIYILDLKEKRELRKEDSVKR